MIYFFPLPYFSKLNSRSKFSTPSCFHQRGSSSVPAFGLGTDILCNLSHDDYRQSVKIMEKAILATDLSRYFAKLPQFRQILDERISAVGEAKPIDDIAVKTMWQTEASNRELLMCMLMTASDVSASTKPWPVQKKSAELVANEFFEQGDFERQKLNIKPDAVMDRELSHQFPQMQIEFIDAICAPVYELISRVCVRLRPLLEGCLANRDCWDSVAKGETVKEASMRLPGDAEGADAGYRDRLMALLNAPSSSTAIHLEGPPTSSAVPNSDTVNPVDFPASSVKTTRCAEDNDATSSTTVGGGGAAP
ncbi:cGMP-specific 3'5'-cyclic phosphodiesterase [Taenia solium]|eukprot:TsM_001187700 transcript=TsM_001187700 gene=TsM_001187700